MSYKEFYTGNDVIVLHNTNKCYVNVDWAVPLFWLKLICISLLVSSAHAQTNKSQISTEAYKPPISYFSRLPSFQGVNLSPNGLRIAFVQNFPKPTNLAVLNYYDYTTGLKKMLIKSDNKKIKINWYRWANDDILLLSVRYERKTSSTRYYRTLLYSIDITEDEIKLKTPLQRRANFNVGATRVSQKQDSVIDYLPNEPDYVLIEVDLDTPGQPSVYKVNLRNQRRSRIERGKLEIRSWMTDQQSNVRIGRAQDYDTGEIVYYERKTKNTDFRKLFTFTSFDDKPIEVLGFALDPNILYFSQYKGDKSALYKMDLTSLAQEVVLENENYDVSGRLLYSKTSHEAIGLYDGHSPHGIHYFNDEDYKLHKALDKIFPDNYNSVVSKNDDESVYILRTQSDNTPAIYYYGDRNAKSLARLLTTYPELESVTLPHHEKLTYKARDGAEIEAYLSKPAYGKAPFPTVIHPHGGPGARDRKGFDPFVSYMNSRGYAVMRPNFRGSTGYGYEFAQAQMGRWGLEMQDDITDATKYLIEEGIANPNKICIFGASYGGYAATMAAVKTPNLYACAASFAGVMDLRLLVRNQRRFSGGDLRAEKQIGDDSDDLKARSPAFNVEQIDIPILLIHGKEDRRVQVLQSREFAEALEDNDKTFKYVEFEFGDHHLSMQQDRDLFFKELDAFLTQHLGSPAVVVEEKEAE